MYLFFHSWLPDYSSHGHPGATTNENHTVSEAGSQEERCLEQERSEHKVEAWHGARKLGSAEVDQGLSSKALSSFQPMLSFPRHKRRDVQGPARYRDQKLHKSFRYGHDVLAFGRSMLTC
jgi:hypothetical protein